MSWEQFLDRMSNAKADWKHFDREHMEHLAEAPTKSMMGWEGRTIYFIKGGTHPDQWTRVHAERDAKALLAGSYHALGPLIKFVADTLRSAVPPGHVIFNFLFRGELGEGQAQARTEPGDDGIEIRDLVFSNKADSGFWNDLKNKYSATEIVVDCKNKDAITREDIRQLYCYLKPALGFWGFIVCRSPPSEAIRAFNRTLYKNFSQQRGVLILCDDDVRRMVEIATRGKSPSTYLHERMSEFVRSI